MIFDNLIWERVRAFIQPKLQRIKTKEIQMNANEKVTKLPNREADEAKKPTPETPTESKEEKITHLLKSLAKAHAHKDDKAGRKIRRNLRKLGYYISKVKAAETAEAELAQ